METKQTLEDRQKPLLCDKRSNVTESDVLVSNDNDDGTTNQMKDEMSVGATRDGSISPNHMCDEHSFTVDDMPSEMLDAILNKMTTRDLLSCRQVNRQWNETSSRIMCQRGDIQIVFSLFGDTLTRSIQSLPRETLLIDFWPVVTSMSSLTFNDLIECLKVTKYFRFRNVEKCNEIESFLSIWGRKIYVLGVKMEKANDVEMLALFLEKAPNLKRLYIDFGPADLDYVTTVRLFANSNELQLPQLNILRVTGNCDYFSGVIADILKVASNLDCFEKCSSLDDGITAKELAGSKAIIEVVKNHLVAEPLFSSRKIVLVLHAIGEAAIVELIEKFPILDVTMPVELPSPESSETSGLCSGFASSRKVEMHDLQDGESEFGYLQSDMQSKTWNEKMYLSAALFGDYINNPESDSDEVLEEGRSERDYFTLSSNDFIPSEHNDLDDNSNVSASSESRNSLREEFERTAKSLELTMADSCESDNRIVEKAKPSGKQLSLSRFGFNSDDMIPSFEDAYPTYWVDDMFVKSFVNEGGWISKDLYLVRGLKNENYSLKGYINFIYKNERIFTKAKFRNDENKNKPHKDVKCRFNPECKCNKKIMSVADAQKHHREEHKEQMRALNRPLDPYVLHFEGDGWYIYSHCGSCHRMPLFGWPRHISASDCGGAATAKWKCLNLEYFNARTSVEGYEFSESPELLFDICTAAGEYKTMQAEFVKAQKVDLRVRNNVKWLGSGENRSSYQHKYYAIMSKTLKRLYIGSTGSTLGERFYRHSTYNPEVNELLCQDDCLVTMFAVMDKAKISRGYDELKASLEYYFVNTVKLQEGWKFVNDSLRPDIC